MTFSTGTAIEVANRFTEEWSSGFEVLEVVADGYRIRRRSDGTVIPTTFTVSEVREELLVKL
ncbi:MAG: hypothetical protein JOZ37_04195 [Actinobacteria bacterium]|nr:hypothetical protein [Actinomycetota bacterium]MBV8958267.1 hypothetical protein [Actinomycetota bacterium]MBV9254594.1 hypothetical protein [Actinomycetota bacterium]MBV9663147.1 hypothetical protein [Actinomycetota bacterium]MBV9935734.1 hypothetical protein [Actinomycetota bacterium]